MGNGECLGMSTLSWTIDRTARLVTIRGRGVFDLPFIKTFREAMWKEETVGLSKLIDLTQADIQLSESDLQEMAATPPSASVANKGSIAIVIGANPAPLLVDMAVLLKTRTSLRRRLRLFMDEAEALQWLASEMKISDLVRELPDLWPKRILDAKLDC